MHDVKVGLVKKAMGETDWLQKESREGSGEGNQGGYKAAAKISTKRASESWGVMIHITDRRNLLDVVVIQTTKNNNWRNN